MVFVFRILFATGKFVITLVVILIVLFMLAWIINRGVQVFAQYFGYEVGDFFEWIRSMLPEKKTKNKEVKD